MPPSMLAGPTTIALVGDLDADRGERLAIAAQPPAGDAVGSIAAAGRGRLDAEDEDVAMAEAERCSAAARAPPTSSISIDAVVRQRVSSRRATIGSPARRICSISGWSSLRPIATTPSTVARLIARARLSRGTAR